MLRIILIGLLTLNLLSQEPYSIAIILDDINEESEKISENLLNEINTILGKRTNVKLKYRYLSNWSKETILEHMNVLNRKKDVDLILAAGAFTSSVVGQMKQFPKPVVLVGVFDQSTQGIPYHKGKSGVKNLTYIRFSDPIVERLKQFYRIYPFKRLGFLYDKRMLPFVNLERAEVNSFFLSKNASYKIISFDGSLERTDDLSGIDAVFIGDLRWVGSKNKRKMYEIINSYKLPSFTLSPLDVAYGAFSSTSSSDFIQKIIRRLALLVESIYNNEDLAKLDVDLEFNLEYQINFATSRKINISPPYDILVEAKLYGLQSLEAERFRLEDVIKQALEKNIAYKASKLNIDQQRTELDKSYSSFYPNLSSSLNYVKIDEKNANASRGSRSENTVSAGISIKQIIFSEATFANKRIQDLLLRSEEAGYQRETYDLVKTVGDLFYDILKQQAFFNIQRENVDVIKQNLGLAKIRLKTGFSDLSDVYRWESQLAIARQDMLNAINGFNQIRRSLNSFLNRPIKDEITIDASNLDSIFNIYNNPLFTRFSDNPNSFETMIAYFVKTGVERAPELKQLNLAKTIQERVIDSKSYEHYLPTVAVGFDYSSTLDRSGAGIIAGIEPPKESWNLGLSLSLPIFNGFSTELEKQSAEIATNQIGLQKTSLKQQLEVKIRNSFLTLKVNEVKIKLSKQSSDFAEKSLKLIQDAYSKGQVSVIELLDAQNTYVKAKSAASSSLYDYLKSILSAERSISSFLFLKTADQQAEFREKFLNYIQSEILRGQ